LAFSLVPVSQDSASLVEYTSRRLCLVLSSLFTAWSSLVVCLVALAVSFPWCVSFPSLSAGPLYALAFLEVTNPRYEVITSAPTDALILQSDVLFAAMRDNRYQDHMKLFENASCVLAGGDILDALPSRG